MTRTVTASPPKSRVGGLDLLSLQAAFLADADEPMRGVLSAIRTHLGMDVAFISEFVDDKRVFSHVDSASAGSPVRKGEWGPLQDSYCVRVVDGRLPELIHDASQLPEAAALPVTAELPVGAHLSVPIRLSDGSIYGTFCCFSSVPDHSLTERDLATMRVFADLAAQRIDSTLASQRARTGAVDRIKRVIAGIGLRTALQPIFARGVDPPVGYEALSRFPDRTPDVWFNEAAQVGLEVELDLASMRSACAAMGSLPADTFLALNVTPATVTSGRLLAVLAAVPRHRIVLEITEHTAIDDYDRLALGLRRLRAAGVRVAVDDAGAGYASFRHILRLKPDFIKLDISITRGIDTDPAKQALADAVTRFGLSTDATVIAEGVETPEELDTLRSLRIPLAQGYLLGRPKLMPRLHDTERSSESLT